MFFDSLCDSIVLLIRYEDMSKVALSLGVKNNRSCEGCTRCCEGWLSGNIKGEEMYPGKPCQFVEQGVGCNIYKDRPKDPCKTFVCMWRADMRMPEHFKPSEINSIVTQQTIAGIAYLAAIETGTRPDPEFLSWFISYCVSNRVNAEWHVGDKKFFIGTTDFSKAMNEKYEKDNLIMAQIKAAENSAE